MNSKTIEFIYQFCEQVVLAENVWQKIKLDNPSGEEIPKSASSQKDKLDWWEAHKHLFKYIPFKGIGKFAVIGSAAEMSNFHAYADVGGEHWISRLEKITGCSILMLHELLEEGNRLARKKYK